MPGPVFDQTGSGSGNGAVTYTLTTITIAANSVVYVKTHVSNTGTAVPTATGLTYVQVGSNLTSSNGISRLYRAFTSVQLTSNVTTITTTTNPQSTATIDTYTGVDTTGTNGSGATGATNTFTSGGSSAPTANVTTTRDNSLVVAMAGETGALTWTAGGSQTINTTVAGPGFSTSASERHSSVTATSGTSVTGNFSLSGGGAVDLFVVEILSPLVTTVLGFQHPTNQLASNYRKPQIVMY